MAASDAPRIGESREAPNQKTRHNPGTRPILLVCFLGLLLTLLIYAPGYMSNDSFSQLRQARSGVFNDSHPPIMAAIWSVMDRISPGPFGMLMLQAILFWTGLAIFGINVGGMLPIRIGCLLLVAFFPPLFGLIGTIWKDLWVSGALLFAVAVLLRFERSRSVWSALLLLGMLALATGMRHNAVLCLPPILFWWAHSLRLVRAKRRSFTAGRALVVAVVCSTVIYSVVSVINKRMISVNAYFWQIQAVFDVAGTSIHADRNLFPEDLGVVVRPVSVNALKSIYSPRTVLTLYRKHDLEGRNAKLFVHTGDEAEASELFRLWMKAIKSHPAAYLAHRWDVFREVIGASEHRVNAPIYGLYGPPIVKNDLGFVFHPSALNRVMTRWLIALSKTPLYRVWVYILILLGLLALGAWRYWRSGRPAILSLASSGLLYVLPLYILAPASDFRYSLWAVVAVPLCMAYGASRVSENLCERLARKRSATAPIPSPDSESETPPGQLTNSLAPPPRMPG